MTPFTIDVPEAVLADLRERLARTRWPATVRGSAGTAAPTRTTYASWWRTGPTATTGAGTRSH